MALIWNSKEIFRNPTPKLITIDSLNLWIIGSINSRNIYLVIPGSLISSREGKTIEQILPVDTLVNLDYFSYISPSLLNVSSLSIMLTRTTSTSLSPNSSPNLVRGSLPYIVTRPT